MKIIDNTAPHRHNQKQEQILIFREAKTKAKNEMI
jgi:hypothetical protein